MSCFKDIGHAFQSAGETVARGIVSTAETVGAGVVTAAEAVGAGVVAGGKTVYYGAKMGGEAIGNLVTHPDKVFSSVPASDATSASARSSAVPAGLGAIGGLDLVFAVGEDELNAAIHARFAAHQLPFAEGTVQMGGPLPATFSLDGTWGEPSIAVTATGQPGATTLTVPIDAVSMSWISEPWPPFERETVKASRIALGFEVGINLAAMSRDAGKVDETVPRAVSAALAGHTDLSVSRLLVDFQNARLATLTHVDAAERLTDGQLATVQRTLLLHFKRLGPDKGVLGYVLTDGQVADPGGQGLLKPSAVNFSTSVQGGQKTLNYLMMTGGRRFDTTTGHAGGFSRALLPAGWPSGMVLASRLFAGELIERRVLDVVAAAMGRGAGFTWDATTRRWTLEQRRDYSGLVFQKGEINDVYTDGGSSVAATASVAAPGGTAIVVRVQGTSHWQRTLWLRPYGNRQDLGTTTADASWSLSVAISVTPEGQLAVSAPPPMVTSSHHESRGDAGELVSLYSSALNDMQRQVAQSVSAAMGIQVQGIGEALQVGLATAAASIVMPGGGGLLFDAVALDDELNLLVRARYAPVVIQAPPAPVAVARIGSPEDAFDDWPAVQQYGPMTSLRIVHGNIVGSIQATCGPQTLPVHGGAGGAVSDVAIDPADPIVQVTGSVGDWFGARHVLELRLRTRSGRWHGPFGNAQFARNVTPFSWELGDEQGRHVAAFHGSTRTHSDGLTGIATLGATVVG